MYSILSALQSKFDVLILGDSQVGKSSLLFQFIHNQYYESLPSVEELCRKMIPDPENEKFYEFTFLDSLATNDMHNTSKKQQILNSTAIMFVYSITSQCSFDTVEDQVNRVKSLGKDVPIMLVATKTDESDERQVSYEQGLQLSHQINAIGFVECSAKENTHVKEAFQPIIDRILPTKVHQLSTDIIQSSGGLQPLDSLPLMTDEDESPIQTPRATDKSEIRSKQTIEVTSLDKKQSCCVIV